MSALAFGTFLLAEGASTEQKRQSIALGGRGLPRSRAPALRGVALQPRPLSRDGPAPRWGSWAARSTRSTTATSSPRARSPPSSTSTRSSSSRPASPGRRPTRGHARRGPLPDDGHRDGVQPALLGEPDRHRPRRADVHRRHPARPARGAADRTGTCTSSPAPTPSPRSSPGATPTSVFALAHFVGVTRPGHVL